MQIKNCFSFFRNKNQKLVAVISFRCFFHSRTHKTKAESLIYNSAQWQHLEQKYKNHIAP